MDQTQLVLSPVPVNDLVNAITQNLLDKLGPLLNTAADKEDTESETYITRVETAKILRITLPTLHKYILSGIIPAYRMGRKVRFKKHEVQQALTKIKTV